MVCGHVLVMVIFGSGAGICPRADGSDGPSITFESSRFAAVSDIDGALLPYDMAHDRMTFDLFAPLPETWAPFMILPYYALVREHRYYRLDSAPTPSAQDTVFGTHALGIVLLSHDAPESDMSGSMTWGWFATAFAYDGLKLNQTSGKMYESATGITFKNGFNLITGQSTTSLVGLRVRKFPHTMRYLPLIGSTIKISPHWSIAAQYPSHFLVTYEEEPKPTKYYFGAKIDGREYPVPPDSAVNAWIEGYSMNLIVGGRWPLALPLCGTLEAGVQQEEISTYDSDNNVIASAITSYAPVLRLGLDSYF